MLLGFGWILLLGMAAGWTAGKCKLPPLLGMLLVGIVIGPYGLNLLNESVLAAAPTLRRIALVIILIRAGLNLKIDDLKKVGRPAVLLCFVPATLEIVGTVLIAPWLLHLDWIDSVLLGTVIAAVSPAVIVPHMLKLMDEGYGAQQGVPQMILAGASADDVYVIALFTAFCGIAQGDSFSPLMLLQIPTSIVFGIAGGLLTGWLLSEFVKRCRAKEGTVVLMLLGAAFLLVSLEDAITGAIGFSGLLAVMFMGVLFAAQTGEIAASASAAYAKIWKAAEIVLFVLVGAAVDVRYAAASAWAALLLLVLVLLFRMLGVALCLLRTQFTIRERLFCMLAYLPKATVQAAIGAIPLSMGLASGETILTVAVLSILFTAPLGALLIDRTYRTLLRRSENGLVNQEE